LTRRMNRSGDEDSDISDIRQRASSAGEKRGALSVSSVEDPVDGNHCSTAENFLNFAIAIPFLPSRDLDLDVSLGSLNGVSRVSRYARRSATRAPRCRVSAHGATGVCVRWRDGALRGESCATPRGIHLRLIPSLDTLPRYRRAARQTFKRDINATSRVENEERQRPNAP